MNTITKHVILLSVLLLVAGCSSLHSTTGASEVAKAEAWFVSAEEAAVNYLSFVAAHKDELGSNAISVGQAIQKAMIQGAFVDTWTALQLWKETRHVQDQDNYLTHKRLIIKLLNDTKKYLE